MAAAVHKWIIKGWNSIPIFKETVSFVVDLGTVEHDLLTTSAIAVRRYLLGISNYRPPTYVQINGSLHQSEIATFWWGRIQEEALCLAQRRHLHEQKFKP
jgi:hypothetical protein